MAISIYVDENTQAGRIIARFGNARRLAELMDRKPSTIYRWMHPRSKGGTGGLIPSSAIADVMAAARRAGIMLSPDDLYPRPRLPAKADLAPVEES